MESILPWPTELASDESLESSVFPWFHSRSNLCLDFHGDPIKADLVVFSDGNHHMALLETLAAFKKSMAGVQEIYYATTPPSVLVQCLQRGSVRLGNLILSRQPDLFIGPEDILKKLVEMKKVTSYRPFMKSRGNVLLVRKGNPKSINGIADVMRADVRLFISNPDREKASFLVYEKSLLGLAQSENLDVERMVQVLTSEQQTVFGDCIHHREAPQALVDRRADVAMVYYHLALRYSRIFPDLFDFVPLGGDKVDPQPARENVCTTYFAGIVSQCGPQAQGMLDFLFSDRTTEIYTKHGLVRP